MGKRLVLLAWFYCLPVRADLQVTVKAATYNLQGWGPNSETRQRLFARHVKQHQLLKDASMLMVQESIHGDSYSTASQLANALGWKSYSQRRRSDREGLGFVYPPSTQVLTFKSLHLMSKDSIRDYDRMAMSVQIKHPVIGPLRFINTHLAHAPYMNSARERQLVEIIDWVRRLEKSAPSNQLIFGGDFNTGPDETYYRGEVGVLKRSAFNFDLIESFGAPFTWIDRSANLRELIDHFFVPSTRFSWSVQKAKTEVLSFPTDQKLSDHNLAILTASFSKGT